MLRIRLALVLVALSLAPLTAFAERSDSASPKSVNGAATWTRTNIDVSTALRDDPSKLYPSGEFAPVGFSRMVLSFQGEARKAQPGGKVGVLLIPDEEAILRAMNEDSQYQFAIEVAVDVAKGERYFSADQIEVPVTFESYRVYFFNETGERVLVNVYAYLIR